MSGAFHSFHKKQYMKNFTTLIFLFSIILNCCPGKTIFAEHQSNKNFPGIFFSKTFSDAAIIQQPVIPGDCADPSVIRVGNTYYATGTSSEWAPHYPLFKSTD